MRRFALLATTLLTLVGVGVAPTASAAPAAEPPRVPAYGHIWIEDTGSGPTFSTTYTAPNWDCRITIGPPTMTCTDVTETLDFDCPLMILRAETAGGAVQGFASCSGAIGTRLLVGVDQDTRNADLGRAPRVTCIAGGISGNPLPPYAVECYEPGLPTL